jgi:sugar lactone lactonase YvrE
MAWPSRHIGITAMVAFLTLSLSACGGNGASVWDLGHPGAAARARQATSTCVTTTCIYVTNTRVDRLSSIAVFPTNATGNVAPVQLIEGSSTGLIDATGVAVDAVDNIYVSDIGNGSQSISNILVFPAGSTGNTAPIRTIVGSATKLEFANAIAVDTAGNIYVANQGISSSPSSINVYAAGATGNAAPIRTIVGSNTQIADPDGIAVDSAGRVYCANEFAKSVTVYAAGASGNVAPIATIAGHMTGLNLPMGMGVDSTGKVYVADYKESTLTVYAAGATGNVKPVQRLAGAATGLKKPKGATVDAAASIYATNLKLSSITVYPAGSTGNAAPSQTIKGRLTQLAGITGIAVR